MRHARSCYTAHALTLQLPPPSLPLCSFLVLSACPELHAQLLSELHA